MSSRDIDTTSENVLHDWAREEGGDADSDRERRAGRARRAGGAAPNKPGARQAQQESPSSRAAIRPKPRLRPGGRLRARTGPPRLRPLPSRRSRRRGRRGVDRAGRRGGRGRRDRDRRDAHARRALAGARRGRSPHPGRLRRARGRRRGRSPGGRRRRVAVQRARDEPAPRGSARRALCGGSPAGGDHDHGRAGRVRATAGRDGAREDSAVCVHRGARVRHSRRHAALRLRLERGRERPPARRSGDGRPGVVRRSDTAIGSSRPRPGSARAPRPCGARSRWRICSRISAQPRPIGRRRAVAAAH